MMRQAEMPFCFLKVMAVTQHSSHSTHLTLKYKDYFFCCNFSKSHRKSEESSEIRANGVVTADDMMRVGHTNASLHWICD